MFSKIKFWLFSDRLGPDMPLTHFLFYSNRLSCYLARKKFKSFGKGSSIRPGVYIISCSKISIGDFVTLRPGTMLFADPSKEGAGIKVEDKVLIGSDVHIYVNNHSFNDASKPIYDQGFDKSQEVLIKEGAWIGAKAIILPGVTIGKNSVVGAGSVVTRSVPDFSVVVGCPAKIIKRIDENECPDSNV